MKIEIVHRKQHLPDAYQAYLEGQRAVRIVDEEGNVRGECIWTLAGKWRCVFEIKEIAVYNENDRRQGWASWMLREAVADMKRYVKSVNPSHRAWKVFLFCEGKNDGGRAFYTSQGFVLAAELADFYGPGNTGLLYTMSLDDEGGGGDETEVI